MYETIQNNLYSDEEVYIFDDYDGWVDQELNYYDKNCEPAGYFDNEYYFYDMKGVKIPGGYKGGDSIVKRISEIKRYIKKV